MSHKTSSRNSPEQLHDLLPEVYAVDKLHLAHQVHQEEKAPVAYLRQAGAKAASESAFFVLGLKLLLNLLPLHPERRIGDEIVELIVRQAVMTEGVALDDVLHIGTLDEHVGLADGVGFFVRMTPGLVSASASSQKSRLTIYRG